MQELILLGLLKDGPKHGYEIKKLMKQTLSFYTGIELTSIYYPLENLKKQGLINKKLAKSGKRPEKFIYSLTKKGEERFGYLLRRNFLVLERPFINLDISLYFLPHAKKDVAKRMLQSRLRGLKRIEKWAKETIIKLSKKKSQLHLEAIIQHNLDLVQAEIKFNENLIQSMDK